jgi:pyruvate/oxaloacetate carboxyltransferase
MINAKYRLSASVAIFFLLFMQQTAFAEHAPVPAVGTGLLGFQLPDVDRGALVEKVEMLRGQLIERKQALARSLEDKKLDSGDALITAIIPGGLLYAGYKQLRYEQAKEELARINAEINEFSDDILAMQAMSAPATVAQLY